MKKLKDIFNDKKKLKKILFAFLYLIYVAVTVLLFYKDLVIKEYVPIVYKLVYIGLALLFTIVVSAMFLYVYKKEKIKPENFFLLVASILGCIYIVATPVFKAHDEHFHWYKSYAVSLGNFTPAEEKDGLLYDALPTKVQNVTADSGAFYEITYKRMAGVFLKSEVEKRSGFENNEIKLVENTPTAYYPFIQMLPQALGINVARILNLNIFLQALFARFGNFLFYLIVGYFAIKLIPSKKYLLVALLLCPKVIYISTSMSGDVFTNGVSILFIAYILNLIHTKRKLNYKDYIFLPIITICVAISKIVYLPLCALLFFIPKECYNLKDGKHYENIEKVKLRKKIVISLLLFVLGVSISLLWFKISSGFLSTAEPTATLQAKYVFTHPISFALTLLRTTALNFSNWALDIVGGYMQWGQMFELYPMISVFVYVVFFGALFVEEENIKLTTMQKIIIFLIFAAAFALVLSALYVQWTPKDGNIGGPKVNGVQGRYFTPIFMLLPILVSGKYFSDKNKLSEKIIYYGILLWTLPTLLSIAVMNII